MRPGATRRPRQATSQSPGSTGSSESGATLVIRLPSTSTDMPERMRPSARKTLQPLSRRRPSIGGGQHILWVVASHSVHRQSMLIPRADGSFDADVELECGCSVTLVVPAERTVVLASGERRVVG